jgi:multicomponent Na+:H+ antiporter subunit D
MNHQILPLFIAVPLGAGFLMLILAKIWRRGVDTLATLTTLALVVFSVLSLSAKPAIYKMGNWTPPLGINLVIDGLSMLLLLTISVISFLVVIFSINYMTQYTSKNLYYTLLMLMIAGMNGVVLSGDMFNMYVFLEIAAIASYALVAFGCEHEGLEASFKYIILGGLASSLILFGIALMYNVSGTLNMADLASIIASNGINKVMFLAAALFLMGFGLKGAMVPFHAWLPDAHPSAPAPISAMLSGLLIKALGIYALVRIFYNVLGITREFSIIMMTLGALSMVVGVLLAVGQWDLKRLLAYHSISQMGYVMLGIGIGTPLGIVGGLFHLVNHATFKSLLFLCSGSIEYRTGTRQLKEMGGLYKKMPLTSASCSIASLSISGVPPFNGFWSKLIIIMAAAQAGHYALAAITVLVSFLTLVSFIKVQRYALFGKLSEKLENIKESPWSMGISMTTLAVFCIGLGVLSPFVIDFMVDPARDALLNIRDYISLVLPGG